MSLKNRSLQRPIPTRIVPEPIIHKPFVPLPEPKFSAALADALAETIPKLMPPSEIEFKPPEAPLTPVLTQEVKHKNYKNFTVDLSEAHVDMPLGLMDMGIIADTMTIIRADSPFYYKLNSTSNDATPAEKGQVEDQFEIEEIYITNEAASGQAIIRIAWNPYLIRLKPT